MSDNAKEELQITIPLHEYLIRSEVNGFLKGTLNGIAWGHDCPPRIKTAIEDALARVAEKEKEKKSNG